MCRRPLCRVCFACKAGCRCCPQKSDQEGQGGPGHKEAPLPCHPPGLASLCCHPLRSSPPATPLITSPLDSKSPPTPPTPHPSFPAPVRHATPPSPPIPSIRPLDHPSATLLAHAVVCLLGNKLWLVYGGTLSFDIHTHTHTHTHTHRHTHSPHTTSAERKT